MKSGIKSYGIVLACRMLLIGLMLGCCSEVWAQGHTVSDKASGSTGLTAVFRTELAQAEQDIALRLEELEGLQQQRDDLQQALAAERSAQAEAESSGDERRQKAALEDVQVRIDDLTALAQKIRTVQMLYDQAVAGYMLASERQRLYRVPAEGGSAGPRGPILLKERGSNLDY